jgi:hypothetical protein
MLHIESSSQLPDWATLWLSEGPYHQIYLPTNHIKQSDQEVPPCQYLGRVSSVPVYTMAKFNQLESDLVVSSTSQSCGAPLWPSSYLAPLMLPVRKPTQQPNGTRGRQESFFFNSLLLAHSKLYSGP